MRLYIHWPFCLSRCAYCDFNARVASGKVMDAYRGALLRELSIWSGTEMLGERSLRSIYLGGGTPSTLSGREVASLLHEVAIRFEIRPGAEVTVEVNPATWSREDFIHAGGGGANRYSVGVQSFDDAALRILGRAHDAAAAREALRGALVSGASSVSVDLLYGLPDMRVSGVIGNLEDAVGLRPQHISLYALTLSEKSRMAAMVRGGAIALPHDEEVAEQYLSAVEFLASEGYEQYEISNFAVPGHHSRHNMAYWMREDCLGVGAGAHSLMGRRRFANTGSVLAYVAKLKSGLLAVEHCELLERREKRDEEIMLGLRTSRGIPSSMLEDNLDCVDELERIGLAKTGGGRVRLSARGMLVSNAVIEKLVSA